MQGGRRRPRLYLDLFVRIYRVDAIIKVVQYVSCIECVDSCQLWDGRKYRANYMRWCVTEMAEIQHFSHYPFSYNWISSFLRLTCAFSPGWATWVTPRWNHAPSSGTVIETSYFMITWQRSIFCIYDAKNLPGHAWDPWPKLKCSGDVDVKLYDAWLAEESVFWRRWKNR